MTVRGRTLPTHLSIYRSEIEGVKGFVMTIDGRSAFIDPERAAEVATYLAELDEQPVEVSASASD